MIAERFANKYKLSKVQRAFFSVRPGKDSHVDHEGYAE